MNETTMHPSGTETAASFWRRLLHRWLIEYNPLYLLSATLVLGGMVLTSRGLAHEGSLYGELGVAGISEVYAAALIGGTALLTRIRQRRPAVMLALLTVLYQADLTLHTETCAYLGSLGIGAAAAWLALFVLKLYALAWALQLRISRTTVATATLGALGLAVFPHYVARMDPRSASALIALWVFALCSLQPLHKVTSTAALDPWGDTVLRRGVRATWLLWALLATLHVLFWSMQHPLYLAACAPVVPLFLTRRIRSEARVWCVVVGTLVLAGVLLPSFFSVTSLVAAIALAMRALQGTPGDGLGAERIVDPTRPYRASNAGATAPRELRPTAPYDAVGPHAKLRLLTGALCAAYLSLWTLGWTTGPWPAHMAALDLPMTAFVLLVVWRARARLALAPLAASGMHLVLEARLIPAPRSLLEWGGAAVGLGFASLVAALAASYALRNFDPRPRRTRAATPLDYEERS